MDNKNFDIIIIGAGIIGSMTARFLSRYKLDILLIEKEYDIGTGASSRNSAIIHSGHDPRPGSLKSRLNVLGNKMWPAIAKELEIPFKQTGSFVVAINEEEFGIVKELHERAILNGVPEIKVLKKNELLYREPKVNPEALGALWTPTTGVIDPFEANLAACENAILNGVRLSLNTEFIDFIKTDKKIIGIKTNQEDFYSRYFINCAGLYSDEVIEKSGFHEGFKIKASRGEYLIFDASQVKLNTVLYPTPSEKGKGTLVSTTTHGNVMTGPNAEFVPAKEDAETTTAGFESIIIKAKKLVPSLNIKNVIAQFAGLRAKGNSPDKDFFINLKKGTELLNLAGIDSPGLAASPAIAEYAINLLREEGFKLIEKPDFNPVRKARPNFKRMSHLERMELVKINPLYGRIICRCEDVTEGEVVEAIHSPIPALTYDAVKRRTWLGTGRCQGSFDFPRIIEILARELKIPITGVSKKENGSEFIKRMTKE